MKIKQDFEITLTKKETIEAIRLYIKSKLSKRVVNNTRLNKKDISRLRIFLE